MLKEDVLPELGSAVTDAAEQLGVSRVALSRVINGWAAISAEQKSTAKVKPAKSLTAA